MEKRRCYFIGNTHIDHTWLWNWTEGFDEVRASFQAALDRMEEFPEFVFTCSTTLHYRWMEENDPALFARIKQKVEEGRWQLAGGWIVQSDDNIPSGESFVRQGLYGQRYFQSRFGRRAKVGYCVDSFGHHAQLPQILRLQGMEGWLHFRPSREELRLPDGPYRWRGIDGTEIIACRPPGWYCTPNDEWFTNAINRLPEVWEAYPEALLFFGVGDHGGGPTIRDLERTRQYRQEHPEVEVIYGGMDEFYARAQARAAQLPVVERDLQYSFRGCYTTNSHLKALNRKAEGRLLMAEKAAAVASLFYGAPYPKDEIDRAWDHLLTNHFHDVICGTCAPDATEEAIYRYGGVLETADRVRHNASKRITTRFDRRPPTGFSQSIPIGIVNALSWERSDPVAFYGPVLVRGFAAPAMVDGSGQPVDFQRVQPRFGDPKWPAALLFTPKVPAGGAALYHLVDDPARPPAPTDLTATDTRLESRAWRVEIDPQTGTICSLRDKRRDVELVEAGRGAADLLVMKDYGDTWGTGWKRFGEQIGRFTKTQVRVTETGPLRARLEIRSDYERSSAVQTISLYRDFDWIEFDLEVIWREQLKTVKIAFPFGLTDARSFYEIPYGTLERPLDGEEQPMQKWVGLTGRSASGAACAVGIAADSIGGADIEARKGGAELRLTLLRSPFYGYLTNGLGGSGYPEVDPSADRPPADQGLRRVTYRLVAGETLSELGLPELGEQIGQPLQLLFEGSQPGVETGPLSFYRCEPATVHLSALKAAEDGNGYIVRLVETRGQTTRARVTGPDGLPPIETTLRPYEIQSWRWMKEAAPLPCNLLEE